MANQLQLSPPGTQVGDVVAGKYRIVGVLGVGGMGTVVRAEHMELHNNVAIKFLSPALFSNSDVVQRFLREAQAAAAIDSEHVVRIFDISRLENGAPYIVMEWLDGTDFARVVQQQGPLPVPDAVNVVVQACDAIAAAHRKGIIHRDIKPSNLFRARGRNGPDVVKVLDFGIAKVANDMDVASTATNQVFGTPMYMSPEQLQSARNVDARTDIWALGAVLFELLSGRPPFSGDTMAGILLEIIQKEPAWDALGSAPPGMVQVISRCLQKDARQRYERVEELAVALAAFAPLDGARLAKRIAGPLLPQAPPQPSPSMGSFDEARGVAGGTSIPGFPFATLSGVRPARRTLLGTLVDAVRSLGSKRAAPSTAAGATVEFQSGVIPSGARVNPYPSTLPLSARPPPVAGVDPSSPVWSALSLALPEPMREHAWALRALLSAWFSSAHFVGDGVVRLDGAHLPETARTAFFAVFLSPTKGDVAPIGPTQFMTFAEPLGGHLRKLAPDSRKLVVVVANTQELGKGVRERISTYQEEHQATVVPLFLNEILKAARQSRVEYLLEDRLFDLHPRPNLFAQRGPRPDPTQIVGLEPAITKLVAAVQHAGAVVLVSGSPGCGKSSLVMMAENGLEHSRFKSVDCSRLIPKTAESLARRVLTELRLSEEGGPPDGTIAALLAAAQRPRPRGFDETAPVLVLEDADWLIEQLGGATPGEARDVLMALARLTADRTLTLVVTGYAAAVLEHRRISGWDNPLGARDLHPIPPLGWRAANRLVQELGLGCNLRFEDEAIKALHEQSAGNVYILRRMCSQIVETQRAKASEHPLQIVTVTGEDVATCADAMRRDPVGLEGGALDLLDEVERRIMETVAVRQPRSLRQLQLLLEHVPPRDVFVRLERLRHMGLVKRVQRKERVSIPLLESWLASNLSAQEGEARRVRKQRGARNVALLFCGLVSGAVYLVLPQTREKSDHTVDLAKCAFRITYPEEAGAGQEIELTLAAEACPLQDEPAAFTVKAMPGTIIMGDSKQPAAAEAKRSTLEEVKEVIAGEEKPLEPVGVRCFGGACDAALKFRVGPTQSEDIQVSVVSKDDGVSHLVIRRDPLSLLKRVATLAIEALSGLLTLAGLAMTLESRLRRAIARARGLVAGTGPVSGGASTE